MEQGSSVKIVPEAIPEKIPTEPVARRDFALKLHQQALELDKAAGTSLYMLAMHLYVIREEKLWKLIDESLTSFEEYLETYRFGMWSRRKSFALIGQIKDLVAGHKIDIKELAEAGWTRVEVVRPAVRRGLVKAEEALADAKALSYRDLRRKYGSLDAQAGGSLPPVCPSCHDCIHLRRATRERGDKLVAHFPECPHGIEVEAEWRYCAATLHVWIRGPTLGEAERVAKECQTFEPPEPVVAARPK